MHFAQRVFRMAGLWGIAIVAPLYFLEGRIGRDNPPAVTHPEFFYGFAGVTLAWQVAFVLIGRDPVRFRPLMPAAMLEKFSFVAAIAVLFVLGRCPASMAVMAAIDLVLGLLFVESYRRTA